MDFESLQKMTMWRIPMTDVLSSQSCHADHVCGMFLISYYQWIMNDHSSAQAPKSNLVIFVPGCNLEVFVVSKVQRHTWLACSKMGHKVVWPISQSFAVCTSLLVISTGWVITPSQWLTSAHSARACDAPQQTSGAPPCDWPQPRTKVTVASCCTTQGVVRTVSVTACKMSQGKSKVGNHCVAWIDANSLTTQRFCLCRPVRSPNNFV